MDKRKDLAHHELEGLSWEPGKVLGSLDAVFQHVTEVAKNAITWYWQSKRRKKRGAVLLRLGAILGTSVAGILPMLTQISATGGKAGIPPAWASVSLGIAAALVGLDRFFGFSSGWTRYIAAEMRLRQILEEFQMDWEAQKAIWKGAAPTDDQAQGMLGRAKAFVVQVDAIVQEETKAWIAEFQTTLSQLDEAVKAKVAVTELGGLNVSVANGDQCENGWDLSIDSGSSRGYAGKTAALRDLVPGVHTLRAAGAIGGKPKQAEAVVSVPAGGVGSAELTLS